MQFRTLFVVERGAIIPIIDIGIAIKFATNPSIISFKFSFPFSQHPLSIPERRPTAKIIGSAIALVITCSAKQPLAMIESMQELFLWFFLIGWAVDIGIKEKFVIESTIVIIYPRSVGLFPNSILQFRLLSILGCFLDSLYIVIFI